jgi:hypothetical protein
VVADQEIHPLCNGGFEGALPGVNSGPDLFDRAIVFDLEPVVGSVEVFDLSSASALIAKRDDFL